MQRALWVLSLLPACAASVRNEAPPPLGPGPVAPAFEGFWSSALDTTVSSASGTHTTAVLRGPDHRLAFGVIEDGPLHGVIAHRMQFLLLPAEVLDAASVDGALCALRSDGKLRCAPVRAGSEASEIAVGDGATRLFVPDRDRLCVLRDSGEWGCWRRSFSKWGDDRFFAEELRAFGPAEKPVPDSRCFLTRDRKLVCFDSDGVNLRPGRVITTDAVDASAGSGLGDFAAGCAARTDGTVVCWGGANETGTSGDGRRGPHEEPWTVQGIADAVAVARSTDHACALTRSKTVLCWGSADGWPLGDAALGTATKYRTCKDREAPGAGNCVTRPAFGNQHDHLHLTPVHVPELDGVTSIAAGYERTCGVRSDGRILCVGGNHPGPYTIGVGEK